MIDPSREPPGTSGYSVLGKATPADIKLQPYPHLVIHDALRPTVFEELSRDFPSLDYIAAEQATLNNHACLRGSAEVLNDQSLPASWRTFFQHHLSQAFFEEFVALWGQCVQDSYPEFEQNFGKPLQDFRVGPRASGRTSSQANFEHDLVLDCVFGANTPVVTPSRVRGPHADVPHKLFSSLLYFREPEDRSAGGEYQLYRMKRRVYPKRLRKQIPQRYLEPDARVGYRANTLVFWLNGARSVHSVTPRSVTPFPRRYVAVTGECYSGRERGGYFARDPQWQTPFGRVRSWLNL